MSLTSLRVIRGTDTARAPRIALVDTGNDEKVTDINGDKVPCVSHYDAIAGILTHELPRAEIVQCNSLGYFVVQQLRDVAKDIESGIKYDAVNLSISKETTMNKLASLTGLPLNDENLNERRPDIVECLRKKRMISNGPCGFLSGIEAVERIIQLGVPVYIAAGNKPNEVNVFGLADDAINVGGLDSTGKVMARTASHSLVNRYARGVYNIYPVDNGYGLKRAGECVFPKSKTSNGKPIVEKFVGRDISTLLADDKDIPSLKYSMAQRFRLGKSEFGEKLFSLEQLIRAEVDPSFMPLAEDTYFTYDGIFPFQTDSQGKTIFSPDGSKSKGAVSYISGTSFAVPTAIALDLRRELSSSFISD